MISALQRTQRLYDAGFTLLFLICHFTFFLKTIQSLALLPGLTSERDQQWSCEPQEKWTRGSGVTKKRWIRGAWHYCLIVSQQLLSKAQINTCSHLCTTLQENSALLGFVWMQHPQPKDCIPETTQPQQNKKKIIKFRQMTAWPRVCLHDDWQWFILYTSIHWVFLVHLCALSYM